MRGHPHRDGAAPVVLAEQVSKAFGPFYAVSDVGFAIRSGECFGLLGPNGAGKSTLMKIIYGVMPRTGGTLSVLGLDPSVATRALRRQLGVVMQEDALDDALCVRDNMLLFCAFHKISGAAATRVVDETLAFMGLTEKAAARIATLSGGMRRRLAFVRALLSNPKLLILDEPTTGLDPAVRQLLWDKVRELKRNGTTIILTTHYMDEAEVLCDRIMVIDGGRVQAEGSPRTLIERVSPGYVAIFPGSGSGLHERVEIPRLESVAGLAQTMGRQPELVRPANLEDVFLKLTGKNLHV